LTWNQLFELAEEAAAVHNWTAANELFEAACLQTPTPAIRIAYGVCLAEQERHHQAICQFCLVLDGSDLYAKSVAMHNLACIFRDVGDRDFAHRFQQQSISISGECGYEELLGVANDAYLNGREALAVSLLKVIDDQQDPPAIDDLDYCAARASIDLINLPRSLISLFRIYRRRSPTDHRRLGQDLLNLADFFKRLGRLRSQLRCLNRAIDRFRRSGCHRSLNIAYQRLQQARRTSIHRENELN
jgi:tetratricopeptide (TPR) repeat protein